MIIWLVDTNETIWLVASNGAIRLVNTDLNIFLNISSIHGTPSSGVLIHFLTNPTLWSDATIWLVEGNWPLFYRASSFWLGTCRLSHVSHDGHVSQPIFFTVTLPIHIRMGIIRSLDKSVHFEIFPKFFEFSEPRKFWNDTFFEWTYDIHLDIVVNIIYTYLSVHPHQSSNKNHKNISKSCCFNFRWLIGVQHSDWSIVNTAIPIG